MTKLKEHKIVTKAKEYKAGGYTHIASIVKQRFSSKYYHVVAIDDIIKAGRWIPARIQQYNGWVGRVGIISSKIDWSTTIEKSCM